MGRRELAGLLVIASLSTPVSAQVAPTSEDQVRPSYSACRRIPAEATSRALSVGRCIRSTLGSDDPVMDGVAHFEDHPLRLEKDQAIRIDMDALPGRGRRPSAFDTYVEVRRPGESVPLAENDDRPGPPPSLNSTLIFVAPATGDYVVRARALSTGTGDYVLRVATAHETAIRELRIGGPAITSRIDVDDSMNARERYYEDYQMPLTAGQIAQIDMEATETPVVGEERFDPFLSVWLPDGSAALAVNDDRGDSVNSRLVFVAPTGGTYIVRAEGLAGTTGNYRIAATSLRSMPLPAELGDPATGIWFDGSHATEIDNLPVRYMDYRFDGTAGERVRIEARSNLRPTLRLGRTDRLWFTEQVGEGEQARLDATLPEAGTYILRIEVPAPHEGTFEVRLTRSPVDTPATQ